jgi:hypothetical protein
MEQFKKAKESEMKNLKQEFSMKEQNYKQQLSGKDAKIS